LIEPVFIKRFTLIAISKPVVNEVDPCNCLNFDDTTFSS